MIITILDTLSSTPEIGVNIFFKFFTFFRLTVLAHLCF